MLNIFPTIGKVTQKEVVVSYPEEWTREFTTCSEALKSIEEAYIEQGGNGQVDQYYFAQCMVEITFHNSDDVFTVPTIYFLQELAKDC